MDLVSRTKLFIKDFTYIDSNSQSEPSLLLQRKITAVQASCYIYRRQNHKHSNFILKTFANLIEPKMWPLCMARSGGPSVDVRIHSWPGPTVDVGPSIARPTVDPQLARAIPSRPGSTVGPEQSPSDSASHDYMYRPVLGTYCCKWR